MTTKLEEVVNLQWKKTTNGGRLFLPSRIQIRDSRVLTHSFPSSRHGNGDLGIAPSPQVLGLCNLFVNQSDGVLSVTWFSWKTQNLSGFLKAWKSERPCADTCALCSPHATSHPTSMTPFNDPPTQGKKKTYSVLKYFMLLFLAFCQYFSPLQTPRNLMKTLIIWNIFSEITLALTQSLTIFIYYFE